VVGHYAGVYSFGGVLPKSGSRLSRTDVFCKQRRCFYPFLAPEVCLMCHSSDKRGGTDCEMPIDGT